MRLLLLRRVRRRPCEVSSPTPFVATLIDVLGIVVYFSIARSSCSRPSFGERDGNHVGGWTRVTSWRANT